MGGKEVFGRRTRLFLIGAIILAGATHHLDLVARLASVWILLTSVNIASEVGPLRSALLWAWAHRWRGWTWWLGALWFVGAAGWLLIWPPALDLEGAFWWSLLQMAGLSWLALAGLVLGGLADAWRLSRRAWGRAIIPR